MNWRRETIPALALFVGCPYCSSDPEEVLGPLVIQLAEVDCQKQQGEAKRQNQCKWDRENSIELVIFLSWDVEVVGVVLIEMPVRIFVDMLDSTALNP